LYIIKREHRPFPSTISDKKFLLRTKDGKEFSTKVCQENRKALMSDPNKDLGEWLLRNKLGLKEKEVATYSHLEEKNADSVIVYKINPEHYIIDLHSFGAFKKTYR